MQSLQSVRENIRASISFAKGVLAGAEDEVVMRSQALSAAQQRCDKAQEILAGYVISAKLLGVELEEEKED